MEELDDVITERHRISGLSGDYANPEQSNTLNFHAVDVKPMTDGDIDEFPIQKEKYNSCGLQAEKYYVKKEEPDVKKGIINTNFFASTDKEFIREANFPLKVAYKNQIGYADCVRGFIEQIWVNDKPDNARGCGISTILTRLCMVDQKLTASWPTQNKGLERIWDKNVRQRVLQSCKNFIALKMSAKPLTGAYAYFSAAKKSGFTIFMIQDVAGNKKYVKLNIEDAEKSYNAKDGTIKLKQRTIKGKTQFWYFCKPKSVI